MKKIFSLIIAFAALSLSAQSIIVNYEGSDLNPNDTVVIPFTEDNLGETLIPMFGYKNVSDAEIEVVVYRDGIDISPDHIVLFCLGQCYNSPQSNPFTMAPGEEVQSRDENGFHINFIPDALGTSLVKFRFQNNDDASDVFPFYVQFTSATGVQQYAAEKGLSVYPNPATSSVTIEYDANMAVNTNVVIKNITGAVVYKHNASTTGKSYVNISNMKSGIYFYGLQDANGRMLCTKKLLVK
ncbi:MAG: T9SS type A sorting domain-containing protein [Bacteroidales bacterium]|nr:T9SS type A sorting domain-containing protein [Bacteroidales bacterium]